MARIELMQEYMDECGKFLMGSVYSGISFGLTKEEYLKICEALWVSCPLNDNEEINNETSEM